MIFKAFGIEIEISYIFICGLTAFFAVDRTGIFIPLFISMLLHEIGHLITLTYFKCKISKISLKIGTIGINYIDGLTTRQKIISLIIGPLVNLIMALVLFALNLRIYSAINILLFIYNLLPIKGTDGGETLSILLSYKLGYNNSIIIQRIISIVIILFLLAFFVYLLIKNIVNYSIILFCIYLSLTLI